MSKTDKIEAEIEEARNNFEWGLVHDKIAKNKKKFIDSQALDNIYKIDELIEVNIINIFLLIFIF